MPVLVEAISVIIRRDALDRQFPGGLDGLARSTPNQTFCCDDHLARVGFMNPSDVRAFVEMLESHGMVFENGGEAIEFAVVDQLKGPTLTAPWLGFAKVEIEVGEVSACWLHGAADSGLAVPAGRKFEGSLSANNRFVAAEDIDDDAGAWGNLAMCLIQCREREEAREAIRQALILDPADPINRMIRDNFDRYFDNR